MTFGFLTSRRGHQDQPESSATSMSKRLLPLDVLRTVAVLLVLGNHMLVPPELMSDLIRKPIQLLRHTGWIGVDLFFVLSGFLVSGLLFREQIRSGHMSIGRFLIRRGLKIYPALYFLVLVTVVVRLLIGEPLSDDSPAWRSILGELLFLQNYLGALWGHTWSLAVEEHFYLTIPLVLLLLAKWTHKMDNPFAAIPALFLVVATFELAARIATNLIWPYRPGSHLLVSHLRFDSLLFGVLLSYYYHYHAEAFVRFFSRWSLPLLVIGAMICGPILLMQRHRFIVPTFGLTFIYATSGVLLSWLMISNFPRNRFTRFLGYLGAHSYSIYLWHYAVVTWFMKPMDAMNVHWFVYTPAYVVLSFAVGIGFAKLIEFPVLRLRDKWFPSLTQPLSRPEVATETEGAFSGVRESVRELVPTQAAEEPQA